MMDIDREQKGVVSVMSFFEEMSQRAFEELAKGKQVLENKYRNQKEKDDSIMDADYRVIEEDVHTVENDEIDEKTVIDVEDVDVSHMDSSPRVIYVAPTEETVEETSTGRQRRDVNLNLKFDENCSLTKEQQELLTNIGNMPEASMDDVVAKGCAWMCYQHGTQLRKEPVSFQLGYIKKALTEFHEQMDVYDHGHFDAWKENEKNNPLDGFSDVSAESDKIVTVDMSDYDVDKITVQHVQQEEEKQEVEESLPMIQIIQKDKVDKQELAVLPEPGQDGFHSQFSGMKQHGKDGMVHYDGVLGSFDYNPKEFQLQVVRVEADEFGNPPDYFPILKYIGDEVDGKNIQIPEGLRDGSFMFEGNETLTSQPKLPSSLTCGVGMFKDCKNMMTASVTLPSGLEDASFMYAGCSRLCRGPVVLPPKLRDATAMFANDVNLGNTPKILQGLEYADSMFVNCETLKKKPKFPHSVKVADYATVGCTGIDETEQAKALKAQNKAMERFEKQQNRKSMGDHLGRVFSMCMQVHALHKSGSNLFMAMLGAYVARKTGRFTRDMAGGWAALYSGNKSNFNQSMMYASRQNAKAREQKRQEKMEKNMEIFKATDGVRKTSSKGDRQMYENGQRAMAGHYFEKVHREGYVVSKKQHEAARMDATELKDMMHLREEAGTLSSKTKSYYAKYAVELVSNQAAYYKGAYAEIQNPKSQVKNKQAAMSGLETVSVQDMDLLLNTVRDLQKEHHFMNERQLQTMVSVVKETPYANTKEFQNFVHDMQSDMVGRFQSSQMEHENASDVYRQKAQKSAAARSDRAAGMDAMYGDKFQEHQTETEESLSM